MNENSYAKLFAFFGGYFHEDWDADDPSAEAVLARFVKENTEQEVMLVAKELDTLLESEISSTQLKEFMFKQAGCYYQPSADEGDLRTWLVSVRDALRLSIHAA